MTSVDTPQTNSTLSDDGEPWLTVAEVLAAHGEYGRLNWHLVKETMGPNWPVDWERLGPGEGIFEPDEVRP
jgi:hypothetical protein